MASPFVAAAGVPCVRSSMAIGTEAAADRARSIRNRQGARTRTRPEINEIDLSVSEGFHARPERLFE